MKKALGFAMVVIAAISLILVSPLTDTTNRVQWQTTDIDAPGGG